MFITYLKLSALSVGMIMLLGAGMMTTRICVVNGNGSLKENIILWAVKGTALSLAIGLWYLDVTTLLSVLKELPR